MNFEEIDERYHDAALDDDGETWDEDAVDREDGWDDPGEVAEDLDPDELDDESRA